MVSVIYSRNKLILVCKFKTLHSVLSYDIEFDQRWVFFSKIPDFVVIVYSLLNKKSLALQLRRAKTD